MRSLSDRADRKDVGESGRFSLFDDEARDGWIIVHWIGVWHRADGSVAARDRSQRARLNRLFIFLSGFAQVRVQINEAGRDDETCRVEHLRTFGYVVAATEERRNAPVFNQEILAAVDPLRRIDHVTVGDE